MVALSGDYDFQFMIEELAVGAQFKLPYIHVLVNNAYLGLIRQASAASRWTIHVRCRSTTSTPRARTATVSTMSRSPKALAARRSGSSSRTSCRTPSSEAKKLMAEFSVPVVVEVILERVTNISMGTELDNVTEFEELALTGEDAPTAISMLD